jgi:hypothetical protein
MQRAVCPAGTTAVVAEAAEAAVAAVGATAGDIGDEAGAVAVIDAGNGTGLDADASGVATGDVVVVVGTADAAAGVARGVFAAGRR